MLAICGGKGGCGKTTTTLGIAGALADAGREVLAVDADRDMPDLHAVAGVAGTPTVAAVGDRDPSATASGDRVRSVARSPPSAPGVGILPAAPGVDRRDVLGAMERVQATDAVGLVDCPAGAGPDAVAPLGLADRAVVVTTPRPASLRDAAKTAAVARAVDTPVVATVVTRADSPPGAAGRIADPVAVGRVRAPLSGRSRRRHREIVRRAWRELFSGSDCN